MITTFGSMPTSLPAGMLTAVNFPVLMRLDVETGDGRIIDSAGFSSRDLPLSIRMQARSSSGHDGAIVSGALFEVTVDPDGTLASGRGFLLDNDAGRDHALYIATGAMRGNSVDLAEVEARYEEDLDTGEYRIRFTKAKLAATTGVGTPAFADARAEITASVYSAIDEIMASVIADPMEPLVCNFETFDITVDVHQPTQDVPTELLASGATLPSWDAFHRVESDIPHKVIIEADNTFYGHLGLWESCHDGIEGRCTMIPRPTDNYASFNKPGVLTDRGIVETGPIFAYGGHRRSNGQPSLEEAYGGIENAWGDGRLSVGKHGPWICGVVRPGVPDEVVYAARASRLSGHWLGGRLKAIVSVNAEGFEVPGSGEVDMLPELAAGFAFTTSEDGLVSELVASFPPCSEAPAEQSMSPAGFAAWVGAVNSYAKLNANVVWNVSPPQPDGTIILSLPAAATAALADDDGDDEQATMLLRTLLDDDDES